MKTVDLTNCTYPIVETFHSIQGEGAWTGVSAFFIRLGGCDVYCPWCDQKESWNPKPYPHQSVKNLVQTAKTANPAIVVITGGEPLMHDLYPLTKELKALGLPIHLETSGSHPFSGHFDWVTFSPKFYKLPHESIYNHANELKVVVANEEDLNWAQVQAAKLSSTVVKYLQPEWSTLNSGQLIFKFVLKHPQWRISLQTHKFLNIR